MESYITSFLHTVWKTESWKTEPIYSALVIQIGVFIAVKIRYSVFASLITYLKKVNFFNC